MNVRKTGRLGFLVAAILTLAMVSLPGNAAAKDRNHDRIPDRWEKQHKLTLKKDQRKRDQDRDGLRNRAEWRADTNPRDRDSDDDGTPDGKENAGFVAAYDAEAGTLKITLYGGGNLEGSVGERTKVECEGDSGENPEDAGVSGAGNRSHEGPAGPRSDDDESEDEDESEYESEDGDDEGEGHHRHYGSCSLDDLAEGVVVHEADVKYKASGAFFTKIEIEKPVAAG